MRDIVGDLLHAHHQRLDAVEHNVEIVGETVKLVAGAGHRQAVAEVAGHDVACGLGHGIDPVQHASRDEKSANQPEHDDHGDRPAPGGDHDVIKPLALLKIASDQQAEPAGQFEHPHQRLVLAALAVFRLIEPAIAGLGSSRACRVCPAPAQ